MKSVYRSDEGRDLMARWYDAFVSRLGVTVDSLNLDTRYGRTHVLVAGPEDAPPLWCFHGVNSTAPAALSQVPELLRHFRIFFPDTVGQPGRSHEGRLDWQGDDHGHWVVDLLDALKVRRARVLGVSLGGYVALRAASVAPHRIDRTVLWVPGGLITPPLGSMLGLMGAVALYSLFPSRPRFSRLMSKTLTENDEMTVDFLADAFRHISVDRRFPRPLVDGSLDSWDSPVMVLAHEKDIVFPAERLLARAKQIIPGLERSKCVAGWKHMPPFDGKEQGHVLNEVVEFLLG